MVTVPLRRRLLLLVAAGIIPLTAMSGAGLYLLARQQKIQVERVGLELARALATGVERRASQLRFRARSLATSPTLDREDLGEFRTRAERTMTTQPDWIAVMLGDPSGKRLVDTRLSAGVPSAPIAERTSFDAVVRTRAPAVGNLGARSGRPHEFLGSRAVIRDGTLLYVLTAVVAPEEILAVVKRQRVPTIG
jgi:hypothetical protein